MNHQISKSEQQFVNNLSTTTSGTKTKYKIVMLGDQNVGKTCVIEKYVHNRFEESSNPTVGIDFLAKNIAYKNRNFRLQLWDTAGQQRFKSLIPSYLKDANCAIIIYDVTSKSSLVNTQKWLKLYNDNRILDGYSIIVGNKIDLTYRAVSTQDGKKLADSLQIDHFQISAKTGQNIQELFLHLLDMLIENKTNGKNNILDEIIQEIEEERKEEEIIQQPEKSMKPLRKHERPAHSPEQPKTPTDTKKIVLNAREVTAQKPKNQKKQKNCC